MKYKIMIISKLTNLQAADLTLDTIGSRGAEAACRGCEHRNPAANLSNLGRVANFFLQKGCYWTPILGRRLSGKISFCGLTLGLMPNFPDLEDLENLGLAPRNHLCSAAPGHARPFSYSFFKASTGFPTAARHACESTVSATSESSSRIPGRKSNAFISS